MLIDFSKWFRLHFSSKMLLVCSRLGDLSVCLYHVRMDKTSFVYEKVYSCTWRKMQVWWVKIVFRWTTDTREMKCTPTIHLFAEQKDVHPLFLFRPSLEIWKVLAEDEYLKQRGVHLPLVYSRSRRMCILHSLFIQVWLKYFI